MAVDRTTQSMSNKKFNFRVMTYNIHKGLHFFKRRDVLIHIRELIRKVGADVVMLQEVGSLRSEDRYFEGDQFEFLADEVWTHYAYGKNAVYQEGHHGNAILSKFPIVSYVNLDLSVNRLEKRGYLECVCEIPDRSQKIRLATTHLNLRGSDRLVQAHKMMDAKVKDELPYCLAGDFNDWGSELSEIFKQRAQLDDAHVTACGVKGKTFPSIWPLVSLDRVYFKGLQVVSAEVVPVNDIGPDHLPVVVEFCLE